MNTTLRQPPADCPNGEICIEEEVQRRRASDRGVWVRWGVGGVMGALAIATGWLLGRVNTHQDKIIQHESEITTLKSADVEIKSFEKERREEERVWKERIENKIDRVVERLR